MKERAISVKDPAKTAEVMRLSLLALWAAQKSGAVGPVWQSDIDRVQEILDQCKTEPSTLS